MSPNDYATWNNKKSANMDSHIDPSFSKQAELLQQSTQEASAESFDVAAAAVAVSNDNATREADAEVEAAAVVAAQQDQQQQQQQQQQDLKHEESRTDGPPLSRHGKPLTDTKRAKQNRIAQRAFRERKDKYIKELEEKAREVDALKATIESLKQDNIELRDYVLAVQAKLIDQPDIPAPASLYGNRANLVKKD